MLKTVTLSLDYEDYQEIKNIANSQTCSTSYLIRVAIGQFIHQHNQEQNQKQI